MATVGRAFGVANDIRCRSRRSLVRSPLNASIVGRMREGGRGSTLLLTVALVVGACGHNPSRCKAVQPGQYFPAGTFTTAKSYAGEDAFMQQWYGEQLCAMTEAPLAHLPADETYRFLWLRSFHHPVSVRIDASGGRSTLVAVELNGAGDREPGTIERRTERTLSLPEWSSLTAAVRAASFWETPTNDPARDNGEDGAEWIVEGQVAGIYHVVSRLSPEQGPFRAVGEAFLRAAGLSFPADEVY